MMYAVASMTGSTRLTFLDDLYKGGTVMLFGGAPTIRTLPLEKLQARGVVTAAINNAAKHFRPTFWFSGDNPDCYELSIIQDPGILKFAPNWHMETDVGGRPYKMYPNMVFYVPDNTVPVSELFLPRRYTPWLNNTLMVALSMLYAMGFRRIILCGSDFELTDGKVYAHDADLTQEEIDANIRLYTSQAQTLKNLKPAAVEAGLTIMDASVKTKMEGVYETLDFLQAIDLCVEDMTPAIGNLPHGTRFTSEKIRKAIGVYVPPPKVVI